MPRRQTTTDKIGTREMQKVRTVNRLKKGRQRLTLALYCTRSKNEMLKENDNNNKNVPCLTLIQYNTATIVFIFKQKYNE